MAPPSIFVGTPSIFESLMLIQIYLYCKTIITQVLQYYTWTKLYHDVILGDRNIYHVTITSVLALTKVSAPIGIFGNALRFVYFGCLSAVGSFTKNL